MIQPTPNYLRLHVEPEVAAPAPPTVTGEFAALCQAFQQATGWSLRPEAADSQQSAIAGSLRVEQNRSRLQITQGQALLANELRLEATATPPIVSADDARRLADCLAGLLDELTLARTVVWQREAELAAGVPIISRHDDSRRLAQRLEAVLQAGAEAVGCQAASLYMLDAQTTQLKLRSAWNLPRERFFDPPRGLANATADLEALSGHAVVLEKADLSRSWNVPEAFAAAVCVPVSSAATPLGTLWLFCAGERNFSDRELNIVEVVAGRLAAELERQMLLIESQSAIELKRQVARAQDLCQHQARRAAARLEGWDVAGWSAQAHQLGGAINDWHMHPDGRLMVAVGEAAGCGLAAALGAQSLRAAFHAHADFATQPHMLLECLNRSFWSQSAGDQTAGLWCATIEPGGGVIGYAWAGRPAMLRLRQEGQQIACEPQLALGLEPQHGYSRQLTSLEPGEALAIFSDSIRATLDECGRPLDLAALTTMLIDHLSASAAELSELVRAFLESHSLDPESEDRAVLVIKRNR